MFEVRYQYRNPALSLFSNCMILILIIISPFFLTQCQKQSPKADLVLLNGVIATMNTDYPQAQAIAVHNKKILYVGDDISIQKYMGPYTEIIDLKGRFVCPGFNDAHVHVMLPASCQDAFDLRGSHSMREIYKKIARIVQKQNHGTWFIGYGWDQTLFPDREWPTKKFLNRWPVNATPVLLKHICGHVALTNNISLRIAGVDKNTPNPPGGEIVKDERTGEPTGLLKGTAIDLIEQYVPEPKAESYEMILKEFLENARKVGLTSIQVSAPTKTYPLFQKLLDQELLTCRISIWCPLETDLQIAKKYRNQFQNELLRFGLLEGYIDGSLGGRTGALLRPYVDDRSTEGILGLSQNDLNLLVLEADKEGFQIGLHANGDRAIRMALDAFELTIRLNPEQKRNHRIEHVHVMSPKDLDRFSKLDIIASMQPFSCSDQMNWLEERIGLQRCRYAHAWKSLLRNRSILAFGSDWPKTPIDPLTGIYTAVTRKDTLGYPQKGWFFQECISVIDALQGYTLGSAYAENMNKVKGSLEPGKWADMVVLNRNLLTILPRDILNTEVLMTFVGGEIVYNKNSD